MRALLTHLVLFATILSSIAQKRYQLPSGIAEEGINSEWIIVKVRGDGSDFQGITNEVRLLHREDDSNPSILDGLCKIRVDPGESPVELINDILQNPNVVYAEPILNYQLLYTPSDAENTTNQDYLEQISAYDAWDITRGDDDIVIGIIDTGLDLDHEDLESSIWINEADPIDGLDNDNNGYIDDYYGYDFGDEDADPDSDGNAHGARAGGVAGADTDNSIGISGVGFNSKIAALKGFTSVGSNSNNLFEAIIYAADMGMHVLNLSWGSVREPLQSEQDILDYAVLEKDVVIAVSAGNDGAKADPEALFYPASYNNVLSVGATDADDNRWTSSTYNYFVDLMAPGVSIYSTVNDNGYGSQSGTSFASPMVAGVAALVRAEFPDLNALQVMERVRVSSDDIYNVGSNSFFEGKLGFGRLNAFNAVSQSNLKSVRVMEFEAETSISDQLFFGDTVKLTAHFTNFLTAVSNPQVTISSPDGNFTMANNTSFLQGMNSLGKDSAEFEIVLSNTLKPETPVIVRLDFIDGAYSDFQHIQTNTSPDHFELGSNLQMTIAGNGNLGFADPSFVEGIGVELDESSILHYAGFMAGSSDVSVSDNIISDYSSESREQDFSSVTNYKLYHHPIADQFGYSEFEASSNNLIIEQSSYAWEESNYILLRYRVVNNSATPINNLSLGFFTDFDLDDLEKNRAEYDVAGGYMFTKNLGETIFAATKIISNGTAGYSALDLSDQNGNAFDIESVFSDAEKYDFLKNQLITSAGDVGDGNDVAMINGTTISQIDPFESEFFNVIIAAAPTKTDLETELTAAEAKLLQVLSNPRILEEVFSCEGSQVTLDPENGNIYQFFEDPDGLVQLHEGTEFTTGSINQDTAFYVRNLDSVYASDVFQIPVKLIEEVADFTIEPDTLYLDHETNVVSFSDQSFEAISWNWNFGQGTTSTIQNPSLSYTQAGEYQISLSVENAAGCMDTVIKNLIVADRPQSPSFNTFNICPGALITLSDPSADFLRVFQNQSAENHSQQGNDLEVGPFLENSTIYVSGTYGQFESLRTAVTIEVEEFNTDFTIEIDTISTEHRIIATASQDAVTFDWFVNDVLKSSSNQLVIDSSELEVRIRLDQTNVNECTFSEEKIFVFSSSSIPSQEDISFCENQPAVVRPQNGEIFGFYSDAALTQLMKKGTELVVTEDTKLFIVGLDDGLPSDPREVNISFEEFTFNITSSSEKIGNKNKVSFGTNPAEGIDQFEWFVDGDLLDTSPAPILFFDNDVFEIVANGVSENGCFHSDTLQLDLIPPLSIDKENTIEIYPNPSDGLVNLTSKSQINFVSVWDIAGNYLFEIIKPASTINLTNLTHGIYFLKVKTEDGIFNKKLIIE